MIGTVLSVLFALIFYFLRDGYQILPSTGTLELTLFFIAALFFSTLCLGLTITWGSLLQSTQLHTTRIIELFNRDKRLTLSYSWIAFFALVSLAIVVNRYVWGYIDHDILILIWFIFFGITLDVLYNWFRHILNYLNPFYIVELLYSYALKSIREEKEIELCESIDTLSVMSIKGLDHSSLALAAKANEQFVHIAQHYFESVKSISHHEEEALSNQNGKTDTMSFTLLFLLQRLDLIHLKAGEKGLETICSQLINVLGKITLHAARFDLTLASHPLTTMKKLTLRSQTSGMDDVALRALCMEYEVAKSLTEDFDLKYYDIKEVFLEIVNTLHEITKNMFRKDKTINIDILKQPFRDLARLLETEKMRQHQDTPVILASIKNILDEYIALEQVMRTVPPIPKVESEEKE